MSHGEATETIPAPSSAVFDLLHDYARRLEWDTLLSAAYLEDGRAAAAKGAISVCVGRRSLGAIALRTEYITFDRPKMAAVKMLNRPPFFETWAASIHHVDLPGGGSRISYQFHFTTRPRWLRFLLDPVMERVFTWETKRRLRALRDYFAGHPAISPAPTVSD